MSSAHNIFIEQHVRGRSFVDVGGLWGTVNEKVSVAAKAGARAVTLMDITPQGHKLWDDAREHCAALGVSGYREVTANLDDPTVPGRVGTFEFVHCSGIIYHCPNPILTLQRLHALTERYLVLGSMTVPREVVGRAGTLSFDNGLCLYLPCISGREKEIVADHFEQRNVRVHNIAPDLSCPWWQANGEPDYAPWWWLWTPDTLAAMVASTGFRVIDVVTAWAPDLAHGIFAEKI